MIHIHQRSAFLEATQEVITRCYAFFSVPDPNRFFVRSSHWDGIHHFVTKSGRFSPGLVHAVRKYLKMHDLGQYAEVEDHRPNVTFSSYNICLEHDLWPEQLDLIENFKASDIGWGCWQSATNSGKTESSMQLTADLGLQTCFVVPTRALFYQTHKRFAKAFPDEKIGMIGDMEEEYGNITVAMADTLGIYAGNVGKGLKGERITRYLRETVQFLIVDECDVAASKTTKKSKKYTNFLSFCNARYRLGMSGTIKEHDTLKRFRLSELFGNIVGSLTNKMQVEKGRSAKGHIVTVPTDCGLELEEMIVHGPRNRLVASLVRQAADRDKQSIVFTRRLDQGRSITKESRKLFIPTEFVSGVTPGPAREQTLKRMKAGKFDCLVANIILDRGVNTPAFTLGIDAHPTYDPARLKQQIGRTLRKKDEDNIFFFVLLKDRGYGYKEKLELLKEEDCYTFHEVKTVDEFGQLIDKVLEDERRNTDRLQQPSDVQEDAPSPSQVLCPQGSANNGS